MSHQHHTYVKNQRENLYGWRTITCKELSVNHVCKIELKETKSTEMQDTKRNGDVFCPASKNCGHNFALSFLCLQIFLQNKPFQYMMHEYTSFVQSCSPIAKIKQHCILIILLLALIKRYLQYIVKYPDSPALQRPIPIIRNKFSHKEIARPQFQIPHSCVFERFIYSRAANPAARNMWTNPRNI
jgi:hypothetical protein